MSGKGPRTSPTAADRSRPALLAGTGDGTHHAPLPTAVRPCPPPPPGAGPGLQAGGEEGGVDGVGVHNEGVQQDPDGGRQPH